MTPRELELRIKALTESRDKRWADLNPSSNNSTEEGSTDLLEIVKSSMHYGRIVVNAVKVFKFLKRPSKKGVKRTIGVLLITALIGFFAKKYLLNNDQNATADHQ